MIEQTLARAVTFWDDRDVQCVDETGAEVLLDGRRASPYHTGSGAGGASFGRGAPLAPA